MSQNDQPYTSPTDVSMHSLPPSYESVTQAPVKLTYVEFWPQCVTPMEKLMRAQFETFDVLVQKANDWLSCHPTFSIYNCETTEKKIAKLEDLISQTLVFQPELHVALYIKGLRLWIYENINRTATSEPIQLGYVDFVPQCLNPGEKHSIFESLPVLYERINNILLNRPLEGKIHTIDTVNIKIGKAFWKENIQHVGQINSRQSSWYDEYQTYTLKITRLFYICGAAFPELIGSVDFLPEQTREAGWFSYGKFAPFSELMQQASNWIKNSNGLHIKNIHTLDTLFQHSSGKALDPQMTFDERFETGIRVLYLRVSYTTQAPNMPWNPPPPPPIISCKTFVPVVGSTIDGCCYNMPIFENMVETVERIIAWFNASGVRVLFAETDYVTKPALLYDRSKPAHKAKSYDLTMSTSGEWYFSSDSNGRTTGPYRSSLVYIIRVYLDGIYQEPHPDLLPPVPYVEMNECCTIL